MKKALTVLIILYSQNMIAQKIGVDWFVRLPQVVNYDFSKKSGFYTPVISTGVTLHYQSVFADVGAFVNKSDFYGYYSYFGSALRVKPLDDEWKLVTNWFGEVTYFPSQAETKHSWTYTTGLSPVLVRPLSWGTFAIALTMGAAFSNDTVSLNTRLILNCSIPLQNSFDL